MTDLLTRIEQNQPVEAQELYDFIVEAIVKQGRPSVGDNDRCLYRGPDGLKCAYGHVHPDSMYSEAMESRNIDRLSELNLVAESLIPHLKLLKYMQADHDGASPYDDFTGYFVSFSMNTAIKFNLKPYGDKT
jgi:hypothetical protein